MSEGRALSWPELRRATPARVGLGRTGTALPTKAHLDFQLAHAQARDAVSAAFDAEAIATRVRECGLEPLFLRSAAGDRATYLRRPDLGRRLDPKSRERLGACPAGAIDVLFVIADGLSATAVNAHAGALLRATLLRLDPSLRIGAPRLSRGAASRSGTRLAAFLAPRSRLS